MNINWAAPTIDIFNLDYPPIINIFRQPSEPFSLDSSHALTPTVLGSLQEKSELETEIRDGHLSVSK